MSEDTIKTDDENLLVVAAVEAYAYNHNISSSETFELFKKYNIPNLIRENYESLHTQDLDDTIQFAEDVLKKYIAC